MRDDLNKFDAHVATENTPPLPLPCFPFMFHSLEIDLHNVDERLSPEAMADAIDQAKETEDNAQSVDTYHCLCSNLLFATTYRISSLARRAYPALDAAYILPCPRLPPPEDDDDSEDDENSASPPVTGYTALLSLSVPARQAPVLIRRSDGFEKRWLLRCGRCKLAVAYQLDWCQYDQHGDATAIRKGRREDVLYVLPGALMTTQQMKEGKKFTDAELDFVLASA